MFFRLKKIRFGTFRVLILCVGLAVLGTVVADFLIRREDMRQRIAARERRHQALKEPLGKMEPVSGRAGYQAFPSGANAIAIGHPFLVHLFLAHFGSLGPSSMGAKELPVGSLAPEFFLPDPSNQGAVRLADFRGKKPILLLFGSFG